MIRPLPILLLATLLTACATPVDRSPIPPSPIPPTWIRAEIFCGLNKPAGGTVSDADYQNFIDTQVTPRFPSGLTILTARGQWRGNTGKVESEPSRVLVILYQPAADPTAESRLHDIAAAYAQTFAQEAVLFLREPATVDFITAPATQPR